MPEITEHGPVDEEKAQPNDDNLESNTRNKEANLNLASVVEEEEISIARPIEHHSQSHRRLSAISLDGNGSLQPEKNQWTQSIVNIQPAMTTSLSMPSSSSRRRNPRLWVRNWAWEVSACLASFGILLAIFGLLKAYDKKAQPQWPYGITLNSALSWLTTTLKSFLLIPAAACISQSVWVYYASRPRSLKTLATYDAASRGPWGAAHLIWDLQAR